MVTKIKSIMKQKGINQSELARRLNIHRTHINRVLNGKVKPSMSLLERIAEVLNCSLKDFF